MGLHAERVRAEGHDIKDEDVARLPPLKHRNVNCLGRYSFTASQPVDGLRPDQLEAEGAGRLVLQNLERDLPRIECHGGQRRMALRTVSRDTVVLHRYLAGHLPEEGAAPEGSHGHLVQPRRRGLQAEAQHIRVPAGHDVQLLLQLIDDH